MKGFMALVFLIIVAGAAGYFFNPDIKNMIDEQLFYNTGMKNHESIGYKWQNEDGVWQLTQTPPAEGIEYEKVKVRDDWNVMNLRPK
ncbi:MAG: hypothetical protein KAT25_01160 [Sulfuriflexus sp.]|nr:hypothetical protein [Sulfuriflexus sp.]